MGKSVTLLRRRNGNRSGSNGSRNGSNGSRNGKYGGRNGRHAVAAGQAAQQEIKNYITPQGYARLKGELSRLLDVDRPELVKVVAWAASNGDRSENGDYLYGKKRLREIDRRIHFLTTRLDIAQVVDPASRGDTDQIYFGAMVTYAYVNGGREERTITIVGVDEVDAKRGHVSWVSPIARALMKKRNGDVATLATPTGDQEIEILKVRYQVSA
ncbi:MAG TPA: transcription elongation factor GreB [Burkholderiales bacterium]|nr:transcription elongation factor GreB [Burkholderiales bacterium]